MKGYIEMKGVIVGDDDPNDETKVPQYATDLRIPEITLDLRMLRLNQLAGAKTKLKDMELKFILVSTDEGFNMDELRRKLRIIRTRINISKVEVACETKNCPFGNKIRIYKNICDGCFHVRDRETFENSVPYDLATLRNLILRISFLEEKISSSLSNQLTREELISFINEAEKIHEAAE